MRLHYHPVMEERWKEWCVSTGHYSGWDQTGMILRPWDMKKHAHPVFVDGFFMDETEVTNREFGEFIEA